MKVLLIEDDQSLARVLTDTLTVHHYRVDQAGDGVQGWEFLELFEYDLVLLDLILPSTQGETLNGIEFCQRLRDRGNHTPVLLMTGQTNLGDKIAGLDSGADDYIIKPFALEELLARMRALLRRAGTGAAPILTWGKVQLNPRSCEVSYGEQSIRLTAKEYELLSLFLHHPHRVFSQAVLLERLWLTTDTPSENAVRSHIKALRRKLREAGAPETIETVYGLGYRLKASKEESIPLPQQPQPLPPKPMPYGQVWQRYQPQYLQRLQVIEQAVAALETRSLTSVLQQQAQQEAHTLKGSLGCLGLREASALAEQIEPLLQGQPLLSEVQFLNLQQNLADLRQILTDASLPQVPQFDRPDLTNSEHSQEGSIPPGPSPGPIPVRSPSPQTAHAPILDAHLLIVENDLPLVEPLLREAKDWGIVATVATEVCKAREAIARIRPDAILLDPGIGKPPETGLHWLPELTRSHPTIPILVFTAESDLEVRLQAARQGAKRFLHKSLPSNQVLQTIVQVIEQSRGGEAHLLVVDDDPVILTQLRQILEPWGFRLAGLTDPRQFWLTLTQTRPDLLILDLEMPHVKGIDLCQVVRNDPQWDQMPILFLSGHQDRAILQNVFAAGADDYVTKPIVEPELIARISNRLERKRLWQLWQLWQKPGN